MSEALTQREVLEARYELGLIYREMRIREARRDFWAYCQLDDVNKKKAWYTDDKPFLKEICDTLQALYEGRIFRTGLVYDDELDGNIATWEIVSGAEAEIRIAAGEYPMRQLMLNMPPRFGKSRTAVLFSQWILGQSISNSIITVTYNEKLSTTFSKGVRDGIQQTKVMAETVVFSDIFPNTKIKRGDASAHRWSLEGHHFNYLGTSFKATITGIGCNVGIIDDSIRTHEDALNVELLENQWDWYLNTFLSRLEEPSMQIIFMTRWAKNDLCGNLLASEAEDWCRLKYEAYYEKSNKVLHEGTMSRRSYMSRRRKVEKSDSMVARMIFRANYHQETMDAENIVYQNLKEWRYYSKDGDYVIEVAGVPVMRKPIKECRNGIDDLFDDICSYTDTADRGADMLAHVPFGVIKGQGFILQPYYTDKSFEMTEIETAENIYRNNVKRARIERITGVRSWGKNVKRLLWENHRSRNCRFEFFYQKRNKESRILGESPFVINNVFFPQGWKDLYPEFYKEITSYIKGGKNQVDDGCDAITGVAEMLQGRYAQEIEYEDETVQRTNEARRRSMRAASRT
jgi:predicted phage terminase large subunit-like protein